MERLTYWCDNGHGDGKWFVAIDSEGGEDYGPHVDRLAAYEETGLEPVEIEQLKGEVFGLRLDKQELSALGPIDRLRELAQADKLIGKTVYYPYAEKILEKRVSHFIIYDERRANLPPKESWFCINDDKSETFGFEGIGKTVFLTREEAESALRREQEKEEAEHETS